MTVPVFGSLLKVTTGFGAPTGAPPDPVLPDGRCVGAHPLGSPGTTWQVATTVTLTPNDVVLVAAAAGAANTAKAAATAAVRSPHPNLSTHAPDHANCAIRLVAQDLSGR
jgi:hypothetical protein